MCNPRDTLVAPSGGMVMEARAYRLHGGTGIVQVCRRLG